MRDTPVAAPFMGRSGRQAYPECNIPKTSMPRIARTSVALLLGLVFLPLAGAAVGRDEAASLAQQKAPGRVLAVERGVHVDNSLVWHVKVLTAAGEVRLIVIDAASGRSR
jgi:uncharacterized membrane protein YkoI